jgi:hypothetical protein
MWMTVKTWAILMLTLVCALVAVSVGSGGDLGALQARPWGTPSRTTTQPPQVDRYQAALAYARCMRAHGVPHPDPDPVGDFRLTPAEDKRLQRVPRARRKAADNACFHLLKGTVSTKPLSQHAKSQAKVVLSRVARCMRGYGYVQGTPVVKDLPRGRAFFGFEHAPLVPRSERKGSAKAEQTCETRVHLADRISEIVARDRGEPIFPGV